jgi:uncharacterized protein (TIGR02594 family)
MQHHMLGSSSVRAGVDLNSCPWMEIALQKFRLQQPKPDAKVSEVYGMLDAVHVQRVTDNHCTSWCSAFVNWCLKQKGYEGTNNALARSWLDWGKPCGSSWGCVAIVVQPFSHVGFYVMEKNGVHYILGGNQNDQDHHKAFRSVNIDKFLARCIIEYRMPDTKAK